MSMIKIVCGQCAEAFKAHQSKIRENMSVTCPACDQPIVFDSNSKDPNIKRALSAARQFRRNAIPSF